MKRQLLAFFVLAWAPVSIYAADGQVLINQAAVNAAGGFPYVISQPGSYKLSGNLILNDAEKSAIRIAADFVTLDLGGFSILGPVDCSSGTCSPSGSGSGIETLANHVYFNITIRNGTIQGMGNHGIVMYGDSYLVEYLHVRSNGGDGITLRRSVLSGLFSILNIVQYCTAELNATGLSIEAGRVSHSNSSRNRGIGLFLSGGGADFNVVLGNLGTGMNLGLSVGYIGNVLAGNGTPISGGVNMGQNLCGTAPCPGVQF